MRFIAHLGYTFCIKPILHIRSTDVTYTICYTNDKPILHPYYTHITPCDIQVTPILPLSILQLLQQHYTHTTPTLHPRYTHITLCLIQVTPILPQYYPYVYMTPMLHPRYTHVTPTLHSV